MMSSCTTHVTSKYGCADGRVGRLSFFCRLLPFEGRIHLYEVDCCSLEIGLGLELLLRCEIRTSDDANMSGARGN